MVMKTPGVYVVEKTAFPHSVVEVATAVPAFVGYTQRADNGGKSLQNKPWRISSMAEFHGYFGFGPDPKLTIVPLADNAPDAASFHAGGVNYLLTPASDAAWGRYLLYYSMLHFFQNGGGPCYIVSVGDFGSAVEAGPLGAGMEALVKEREPTILVIPDAVLLSEDDCTAVQRAMLGHCGDVMRNRVAILDVWGGWRARNDASGKDPVARFRNSIGNDHLDFASAYYPWVHTTMVQDKDLSYTCIANRAQLIKLLMAEEGLPDVLDNAVSNHTRQQWQTVQDIALTDAGWTAKRIDDVQRSAGSDAEKARQLHPDALSTAVKNHKLLLHKSLLDMSALYQSMMVEACKLLSLLPPSAAIAGIYTLLDNTRGVWKAPANISLNGVMSPSVSISHEDQEDLNVTPDGKSINAIRAFIGEGVLVWGARTLDGNSLDWRYISVRRTMIMLEESCQLAMRAMAFEPNESTTWLTIKSMVTSFLNSVWKRGGLAGSSPDDAFSVHVGLGETMTPDDILQGILRLTVLVAVIRPAEFIEITFAQQMQKC